MSSAHERRMNNLRMGIFMTFALGLALVVILALTGGIERLRHRTTPYVATFTVAGGIGALEPGSDVRVGGLVLGRVDDIEADYAGDALERIKVRFLLDRRVRLGADATVVIRSALIGSGAWIEIPNVGGGAPLPSGGEIVGASGGTLLASMVGPESAQRLQDLLARVGEADTLLAAVMGEDAAGDFRETIRRAKETLADAEEFTTWLQAIPGEYEKHVVPILDDAGKLADDVAQRDWPALRDAGVAALDEGRGAAAEARATIADNRETIATSIANVEAFTERLRGELADRASEMMTSATEAVASAREVLAQVRDDYQGWSVRTNELLASLSLAGQQAELAMIEIRRSPWKVLYRPSDTELEHELLYEAARSFALAAGDLKAGTETARLLLDTHGDALREDPALMDRVMRTITGPVERYEAAQKALFEVLLKE